MRINAKDLIAGVPILKVRKFLGHSGAWAPQRAAVSLHIDPAQAQALVEALLVRGDIEVARTDGDTSYYQSTLQGNALSMASAARSVSRATAKKALDGLLERVTQVKENPEFIYQVKRVIVFGSYLTSAPVVNDIDMVVELASKAPDLDTHNRQREARAAVIRAGGKRYTGMIADLMSPYIEVLQFLKSRSRVLSFHDISDGIMETGIKKATVYDMKTGVAEGF
jgi:predicted nucleotidyltransferase